MVGPTEKDKLIATALVKESDRGCVILSAALLADALEELLRSVCRKTPKEIKASVDPLLQGYAPLATFSARIQLTFAFGILPRALRDKIEIIRRMRNDFAHEWGPLDFDDPRCASRLDLLLIRLDDTNDDEQQAALMGEVGFVPTKQQLITRIAFALAVQRMIGVIRALVDFASEGRDLRPIVQQMEEQGLWVGPT